MENILRIIVGAQRPLTIQEIAMALGVATTPGAETATEAGLNPTRLGKKIRQLCGLSVFIKESKIYPGNERHNSECPHYHVDKVKGKENIKERYFYYSIPPL